MRQEVIDALTLFHFAAVVAIAHFAQVGVKVLGRDVVVNAIDLALEQAPGALDPVGVAEVVANLLADAVVDTVDVIGGPEPLIAGVLVSHDIGAVPHVVENTAAHPPAMQVLDGLGA